MIAYIGWKVVVLIKFHCLVQLVNVPTSTIVVGKV